MAESEKGASPKSTRYYYPASRAHHAYCMALDLGMEFETRSGKWSLEGLKHINPASIYRIYIHPESLHLLEPIPGDLVQVMGNVGYLPTGEGFSEKYALRMARANCHPYATGRIILRNGIAFHWPESEAA